MINKLISLVILTFFLLIGHSYSDTQFLYPKKKPSVFKKLNETSEQKIQSNLPQKKPTIQTDNTTEKQVLKEEKLIKKEVKFKDLGSPEDKCKPLTSKDVLSKLSLGKAEPIFIFIFSAVLSPTAKP